MLYTWFYLQEILGRGLGLEVLQFGHARFAAALVQVVLAVPDRGLQLLHTLTAQSLLLQVANLTQLIVHSTASVQSGFTDLQEIAHC